MPEGEPLTDAAPRPALALLEALRPEQWVKNAVVFAALVFGGRLLDPAAGLRAAAGFLVFCGLSGAVYLVNDLRDLERDRHHPVKRTRPLAAGRLPIGIARIAAPVLAVSALAGAAALGTGFLVCAAAYLLLNLAYSFGLKSVVILDVLAVAAGFVLRAVAGALAIPVVFSEWLVLCTMLLALFLSFGKRRHEIVLLEASAGAHRASLQHYSLAFLDQMIVVVLSATVVSYSLYTISAQVAEKLHTRLLPLTIPFVLYGIFRYLYVIHHLREGGSPTRTLFADRPILVDIALWGLSVVIILYFP